MTETAARATDGTRGVFALRRFVYPQKERCDFCRASLADDHAHLLETGKRMLHCVCPACSIAQGEHHLAVPPRKELLKDFRISDAQWNAFQIPIDLAFLMQAADGQATAFYPGPAGVIRSEPDSEALSSVMAANPLAADMRPEVESLLFNRVRGRRETWRVSIDHCYALSGIIRRQWRGLSGGAEVWDEIEAWFANPAHLRRSAGHA